MAASSLILEKFELTKSNESNNAIIELAHRLADLLDAPSPPNNRTAAAEYNWRGSRLFLERAGTPCVETNSLSRRPSIII